MQPRTSSITAAAAGIAFALAAPTASVAQAPAAAAAEVKFTFDLYRALAAGKGNLFFSPYSVHTALAMTREGAAGTTAEQMDSVLHLSGTTLSDNQQALREALQPGQPERPDLGQDTIEPYFALRVANAVWGAQDIEWKTAFQNRLAAHYAAPLHLTDFAKAEAARTAINSWVAERTNDRIKDIVPKNLLSSATAMALVNAIWFRANWEHPFQERATKLRVFEPAEDHMCQVPTMHGLVPARYAEFDDVTVLELDFRGGETTMVLAIPSKVDGLKALEEGLTADRFHGWLKALKRGSVSLSLPKFEFSQSNDLEETVRDLGMTDAFHPGHANFENMSNHKPLFINKILHQAFIAMDEHVTEAAAATVVAMKRGRAPTSDIEVFVNRPFWFAIRHRKTEAILFAGRIHDPRSDALSGRDR